MYLSHKRFTVFKCVYTGQLFHIPHVLSTTLRAVSPTKLRNMLICSFFSLEIQSLVVLHLQYFNKTGKVGINLSHTISLARMKNVKNVCTKLPYPQGHKGPQKWESKLQLQIVNSRIM